MADHPDQQGFKPQGPAGRDVVPTAGPVPETCAPHAAYLRTVDCARKAVAIAMVIFGVGFGICVRRDDYLTGTSRQEPGIWAWGGKALGIGVLACLVAVLALIVEQLARPTDPKRIALRSLLIRALLITIAVVALCFSMALAYGAWHAIGAVIGTFFLLAAVRQHDTPRAILAVLAAIVLGLTLWGTQTAYQYARRHADEVVAAGCELADQCPRADHRTYSPHPESHTRDLVGQEIDSSDPRVPKALRRLGAQRIWVDDERVAVYVGGDTEFQIYRAPHATTTYNPVWAPRWKGSTKFTDRLWTNMY